MRDTRSPTCTVVCLAPFFAGRLCLHLLAPLLWQSLQDGVAQTPRGVAPRPACGPLARGGDGVPLAARFSQQ